MLEIRNISDHQRLGLLNLQACFPDQNRFSKREIEKKATAYLLKQLISNDDFELCYTEHNKPFLKGCIERISISHSHDMLCVLVNSREETGVDIELLRDKVLNIRHKFLSMPEQEFAGSDIERLISLWAAKEALYKVHGRKSLDFKANLAIEPFTDDTLTGHILLPGSKPSYRLKREKIGNYILVYILHEIQFTGKQA